MDAASRFLYAVRIMKKKRTNEASVCSVRKSQVSDARRS